MVMHRTRNARFRIAVVGSNPTSSASQFVLNAFCTMVDLANPSNILPVHINNTIPKHCIDRCIGRWKIYMNLNNWYTHLHNNIF